MRKVICGKYSCVFNNGGVCGLNTIGIDATGKCINYKKYGYTEDDVVEYEKYMQEMGVKGLSKENSNA
jgi:hypothetical protein